MKVFFALIVSLLPILLFGQSTNVPLNKSYSHLVDRQNILFQSDTFQLHTSVKPYFRNDVVRLVEEGSEGQSSSDVFNKSWLLSDSRELASSELSVYRKPILKYFYRAKTDMFSAATRGFDLHINPVIYFGGGSDSEKEDINFINTRGVEIRGTIDDKISFYSFIGENQMRTPSYVDVRKTFTRVVPHEGFYKGFSGGYDFLNARGYISIQPSKSINIQLGQDRNFVGNGYRSLILSDFSAPYLFLKASTQIWKIRYTNMFAQLYADAYANSSGSLASKFPRKYMAFHHLSTNITKNLNIGIFESVIMGQPDSLGSSLDISYLNPIIFYRALEHQNGSADNVILGADFKWDLFQRLSIYGQWVFDELKVGELTNGSGWWGNKYGGQIGLKYMNVLGVDNLDLQLERNAVRPYTYSHGTVYTNYAHYRQPLAHPLGANFQENIMIVRYQPMPRLALKAKLITATFGTDSTSVSFGGDIMKGYINRPSDYDNETTQGALTSLIYGSLGATWQLAHRVYLDADFIYREEDSQIDIRDLKNNVLSVAFRWNIGQRLHEF